MTRAPIGPTKPEAGVMATRPPTAPVTIPKAVGLPCLPHSMDIQARAAVAVATWVTTIAIPAVPSAASSLPALNPNQPTQSMPAPITVSGRLCGGMGVAGKPLRLPSKMAATKPATPALMCTTVPPAKSKTPMLPIHPPPHAQ